MTRDSSPVPPYSPFATFRSGIQELRDAGLPNRIDRSIWRSKSGAAQGALLSAFRFLGLIDSSGTTQPTLKELVAVAEDSDAEKGILEALLRQRYQALFELDLETATPLQVSEAIGSYGATGSTRMRAVRFFFKASEHCGIKLSARLTERGTQAPRATTPPSPRRRPGNGRRPRDPDLPDANGTSQQDVTPPGFQRIDIPLMPGAFIQVPLNLTEAHCAVFEGIVASLRTAAKLNQEETK